MKNALRGALIFLVVAAGCSLYSEVSISPLILSPTSIERGSDLNAMLRKADYLRAIEMTSLVESHPQHGANDLAAIGSAELASGRYDAARQHLRSALDLNPYRTVYAQIAWNLSQVEYMSNNFEQSLEWAQAAIDHGLNIRKWHLDYLAAFSGRNVYSFSGLPSDRLPMRLGRPDVPRVEVRVTSSRTPVAAVVDSGAVLSIVSQRLATTLKLKPIGPFQGTFYGLLGEPIQVDFAMLDTLELGDIVIHNVPVAIMPDTKMKFLVTDNKEFNIDFLLGANLLKEFRIEFDFQRNTATFSKLTAFDRRPDANQNLFIEEFRPLVRGTVNKKGWFLFVLDTGSEVTFLNEGQLSMMPMQLRTTKMHNAMLQGLGGSKKHGMKLDDVQIGVDRWGGTFRNIPMYESVEQEHSAGIVGENFLRNFKVVIDFGRMRVDLTRG